MYGTGVYFALPHALNTAFVYAEATPSATTRTLILALLTVGDVVTDVGMGRSIVAKQADGKFSHAAVNSSRDPCTIVVQPAQAMPLLVLDIKLVQHVDV